MFAKKVKTKFLKLSNKGKLKKTIKGLLFFVFVILASISIIQGNKKESIEMNTENTSEIVSPIVGSSSIEQEAIKESIIVPTKAITVIAQDNSINQKKSNLSKERAKGRQKIQ